MLTLTDNATALVTTLVRRRTDAESAGLRIHTSESHGPAGEPRLAADVVVSPEADDKVVDLPGAPVFLEGEAAIVLDDKVLDANVDEEGAVSFSLLPQTA
ncbi:Fe-S cluster assembly protein HesB [uncultured Microbacterium sp.]|uniref:Fe-S cluster assembly protein HesB n=1 Tax=uncultured Microbacterium sp. TaxID=191216 RepID=UPI0025E675F8|nr:Fe-S cluster assembly protein HesB [uncultured Microbacterium sp.]